MNAVNSHQFHDDLADIADLARPVDLRDRVLRGSKRQSQRRVALASLAALVAVGAGGAAFAAASRPEGYVGPGVTPGVSTPATPPTPSATATPDPTPGSGVSHGSARLSLGPWSQTGGVSSLPGTLYYLTGVQTGQIKINVLADDKLRTAPLRGTLKKNDCALQSIVFSPDGTSVAWVESGDREEGAGALVVTSLDGGTSRVVLADPVVCWGGAGPKWMPDSRRLVVNVGRGEASEVRLVDVQTGATSAGPAAWSGYLAWSANGRYVTYGEAGKIVVATAEGEVVKRVPYDINCCTGGFTVQSISDDGRYVGASFENSDPSTVRNAMKIVDMNTGKNVALDMEPPAGGSISIILVGDERLFITRITDTSTDVTIERPGKDDVSVPVTGRTSISAYRP